jgi:hypothetical protein
MLRKMMFALAATVALGTAALAPTSASAFGGHGHWGHWGHWGGHYWGHYWGPGLRAYAGPGYGGCYVRRWFYTSAGPVLRWVNACY